MANDPPSLGTNSLTLLDFSPPLWSPPERRIIEGFWAKTRKPRSLVLSSPPSDMGFSNVLSRLSCFWPLFLTDEVCKARRELSVWAKFVELGRRDETNRERP